MPRNSSQVLSWNCWNSNYGDGRFPAYIACCRNTGSIQANRFNQNGIKLIAERSLDTLGCSTDDILGFYGAPWRNHFLIVTHQGTIFQLKIETDT